MAPLTKKDIIQKIAKNEELLKTMGVQKLGLFGSYSRNQQKRGSDIDLLVVFDEPTFRKYFNVKNLLEKTLRRKIDLVTIDALKPQLNYIKDEAIYAIT